MRCYAIAASLLASSPLLAQGIVLDDFDNTPNDEAGGAREVSSVINFDPYGQPSSFDVISGFSFGDINGAVVFNSGIGVGQVGTINWDNNDAGLGLDASALEVDGFELDFLQIDQAFEIQIVLQTFGFNPDGQALLTTVIGPATALTTYSFAAGDFISNPGSGFSFDKVDSVSIIFNGGQNTAASLDFILTEFRATTIPSPASLGLLGLGGLVATRRRR